MKVYKFGGASVKDEWGVKNLGEIVSEAGDRLIIVVSALGKTTNMLEEVLNSLFQGNNEYISQYNRVRDYHLKLAAELFGSKEAHILLDPCFGVALDILENLRGKEYDYAYDQFVSQGELWSTRIVDKWLKNIGISSEWIDIRSYLITDSRFRDANVEWNESEVRISAAFCETESTHFVTQGFIGGTLDGETSTLGREGSDFTAAILANICNANELTIWKDVPGVLNVDPRWMSEASKLENISYKEAVEMSFSGAKVIHPKTIKPLHNKSIPLYVKSFLKPYESGTLVSLDESIDQDIPVFVRKETQVLISFIPKDFSFAIGDNLGVLFQVFNRCGIKTNLVQASAVSVAVCIDNEPEKISQLSAILQPDYKILLNEGVEMLTLRYYNNKAIKTLTDKREILIEQRTRKSIRYVVK